MLPKTTLKFITAWLPPGNKLTTYLLSIHLTRFVEHYNIEVVQHMYKVKSTQPIFSLYTVSCPPIISKLCLDEKLLKNKK